jgi:transcriptional regulator with XRE-family HTH domain
MKEMRKRIANNIRAFRTAAGVTQRELGEKLGLKNNSVSNWESAISAPDIDTLFEVCEILGVTINQMYGIAENAAEPSQPSDPSQSSQNQKKPDQIKYDLGMSFEELVERYSGLTVDMRKLVSQFVLMAEVWQKTQPGRNVEGQELVQILAQRVTESPDLREESASLEIG